MCLKQNPIAHLKVIYFKDYSKKTICRKSKLKQLKIHEYWNKDNKIKQQLTFQLIEVLLLCRTGFAELDLLLLCMLCMFLTTVSDILCIVSMVSVIFCMAPINYLVVSFDPTFWADLISLSLSLSLSLCSISISASIIWTLVDFLNGFPFTRRPFNKGVLWLADCLPVCSCIIVVFTGCSGSSSTSSL